RTGSARGRPESRHDLLDEELEAVPVEGRAQGEDHPLGARARVLADAIDHLRRRADENAGADEIRHRAEHEAQVLLLPPDVSLVAADGQAQVHRPRDRARVTSLALAPAVEHLAPRGEDLRREERYVPAVGVARDDAQHALLALAADPEAESRLHRSRQAERGRGPHVAAGGGDT